MSLSLVQPFIGQIFDNLRHPLLRDKCLFVTGGWCCVLRLRGVVCQLLLFFRDHLQQLLPPVVGLPSGQIRKLLLLLSKFVGRLRQIFGAIGPLLGGLLAMLWSYELVFWVAIGFQVASIGLVLRFVDEPRRR